MPDPESLEKTPLEQILGRMFQLLEQHGLFGAKELEQLQVLATMAKFTKVKELEKIIHKTE